jgi:hypothetical protein
VVFNIEARYFADHFADQCVDLRSLAGHLHDCGAAGHEGRREGANQQGHRWVPRDADAGDTNGFANEEQEVSGLPFGNAAVLREHDRAVVTQPGAAMRTSKVASGTTLPFSMLVN